MLQSEKRRHLGILKLMLERTMSYGALINFGMLLYLYVTQSPLGIAWYYWFIGILLILPAVAIIDWKIVFPATLSVSYGMKNKEFTELRKDIKEIQKQLEELKKTIKDHE